MCTAISVRTVAINTRVALSRNAWFCILASVVHFRRCKFGHGDKRSRKKKYRRTAKAVGLHVNVS